MGVKTCITASVADSQSECRRGIPPASTLFFKGSIFATRHTLGKCDDYEYDDYKVYLEPVRRQEGGGAWVLKNKMIFLIDGHYNFYQTAQVLIKKVDLFISFS